MNKKLISALISIAVLALIILYLTGTFEPGRIHPQKHGEAGKQFSGAELKVKQQEVDEYFLGVGTIASRTQSVISGQVNGSVVEVLIRDGDTVRAGQVLLKADDREYLTLLREAEKGVEVAKNNKLQANQLLIQAEAQRQQALASVRVAQQGHAQAEQGLIAAREELRRSEAEFNRIDKLFKSGNASEQQFEAARSTHVASQTSAEMARIAVEMALATIKQADEAVTAAEAGVAQARTGIENADLGIERSEEILKRAQIALSYTEVKAPADGFVGQTFVDAGDLVFPGKPLVEFFSKGDKEVTTYLRESLFKKVKVGDIYDVTVDAVGVNLKGKVTEVIPSADPVSRTFLVRLAVGSHDSIFPGMFARVSVPVGKRQAIFVPLTAIRTIGMLTTVTVKEGTFAALRYVKLGREHNGQVEVISGLSDGDIISVKESAR